MRLEESSFQAAFDITAPVGDERNDIRMIVAKDAIDSADALRFDTKPGFIRFSCVVTGGKSWTGAVERGPGGKTGFYATPDPNRCCILADGNGYLVDVREPSRYDILPVVPVRHVLQVASNPMLILGDFTRLSSISREGLGWTTPRLSWDGLEISSIEDGVLSGLGWDAPRSAKVGFDVELADGTVHGGARPDG